MSTILDKNSNPMPKTQNGEAGRDVADVRAIPTGTLIYNLIKFSMEENGLGNARHQLMAMKEAQKLVADPPQLAAITEHLMQVSEFRYIIAKEVNDRFADLDEAYRRKLGIEVILSQAAASPLVTQADD